MSEAPARRGVARWLAGTTGVLVLAGIVGHWWFWYTPRVHPAAPDTSRLLGLGIEGATPGPTLWLPYPHQHLALLEEQVGPIELWLEALSGTGRRVPSWPRLAGFVAPPARELLVRTDEAGDATLVAIDLFPSAAWLARLAGRLAGNPWLSGGEVTVSGRSARVGWLDRTWWLAAESPVAGTADATDGPPVVAEIRLPDPIDPLPAGRFRLRSSEPGLFALSSTVADVVPPEPPPEGVAATWGGLGGRREGGVVLLAGREATLLPAAVLLPPDGRPRWRLPTEQLLDLLGRELRRRPLDRRWELGAVDRETLDAAGPAGEWLLARVAAHDGFVGWSAPGPTLTWVERVLQSYDELPIIRSERVDRWRRLVPLLAPLGRCEAVWVEVSEERRATASVAAGLDCREPAR